MQLEQLMFSFKWCPRQDCKTLDSQQIGSFQLTPCNVWRHVTFWRCCCMSSGLFSASSESCWTCMYTWRTLPQHVKVNTLSFCWPARQGFKVWRRFIGYCWKSQANEDKHKTWRNLRWRCLSFLIREIADFVAWSIQRYSSIGIGWLHSSKMSLSPRRVSAAHVFGSRPSP